MSLRRSASLTPTVAVWEKLWLLCAALLDIEPRLRKVMGYRHLPRLRDALKRELKIDTTTSTKKAA